jgi:triacylglycerol esterase/lipase EstA (alpha/beta hydrolase family)
MLSLSARVRQFKRTLKYLRGYAQFDRNDNQVVRRTDFTNCPRPVLLLYGFMSTRRVFEVLEHRLRRDQFCVWSMNLGGLMQSFNTRGIDDLAEQVRDKVERLYERFPTMGPMSIIGHSKGGLIGTYYVKRLGGEQRVKNLITLASPHNGSSSAYFGIVSHGLVSRSIWQMTPMSPFIRRLKSGAFPRQTSLVSMYSKADGVNPFPSCILENEFDAPNLRNIEVADTVHREFVTSRSVYQIVRRELFTGYGLPVPAESRPKRLISLR